MVVYNIITILSLWNCIEHGYRDLGRCTIIDEYWNLFYKGYSQSSFSYVCMLVQLEVDKLIR